jgi:hypothetical protein
LGQTSAEHEQLALHLLRALPEEQSAKIAERLFEDEPFAVQMEEVERDLLDAYARDELSVGEKTSVENFLLTSDAQLAKLRFARALAQTKTQARSRPVGNWYAIAAVTLGILGFAGLTGKLLFENRQLKSQIAAMTTTKAQPIAAPSISFLISPVSRSSDAEVVRIDSSADLVRLDLALGSGAPNEVDVRVSSENGDALIERRRARTRNIEGSFYVSVWIPSADLHSGRYSAVVQITETQSTDYSFRVER